MALNITTNILTRSEYVFRHLAAAIIILTLLVVLSPVLLVFRLITWIIVVIVIMCKNSRTSYYGKLISYGDACVDENICDGSGAPPRTSIVATVTLEDAEHTLTIEQLRTIFIRKVLKATIPSGRRNKRKKRYPELQQFLSTLLGFRVWKQDSNFNVANHIVEQAAQSDEEKKVACPDEVDYSKIHQDLLNKPYQKDRSPWEIILMRPVNNHVVLACRMHNVLGDSTSFRQLLTECLGHKTVKTTQTEKIISDNSNSGFESYTKAIKFCLLFPCNHLRHLFQTVALLLGCWSHPWKMVTYRRHKFSTNLVTWSSRLPSEDINSIAKANGVSVPAVIMSICAGAIRQCQEDVLGKKDVAVGYQLEKSDHPDFLTNHGYLGILKLPTSEPCSMKRLGKCNDVLLSATTFHLGKHLDLLGRMAGTFIPYPLTNYFMVNRFVPITMSHTTGTDQDGFCIAGDGERCYSCSDFRISSGTYRGVAGVMLSSSFYKDTMRIGIVANETLMERRQMEMLGDNLLLELEQLKRPDNCLKN